MTASAKVPAVLRLLVAGEVPVLRGDACVVAGVVAGQEGWLVALADDPACVLPVPAGSAVADAMSAATGFAFTARTRLGMVAVSAWLLVSVVCHGRLLAPGWPPP
ncbi:hypothetical protein [Streptomyces sp. NPDC002671]